MYRVMIVSDTHRKLGNLISAIEREKKIDRLIHLGDYEGDDDIIIDLVDCNVDIVPGNNDFFSVYEKEKEINLYGKKIWLTHGHNYYVSLDSATIKKEAISRGYDIVMFGHTHKPLIEIKDDVTLINPGSISYPRQSDKKFTYIMLEINEDGDFDFKLKNI